jgi:hypothetical protein
LKKPTEETENRTETLASTTETPESTDEPDSNATQRDDAPDVTGSGPKPLAEIAKEHGGDAGNLQPGSDASSKGEAVGAIVAQDENPDSKGTGEKYVKTTGLAADGGDFDATKPGAGREADRKSQLLVNFAILTHVTNACCLFSRPLRPSRGERRRSRRWH